MIKKIHTHTHQQITRNSYLQQTALTKEQCQINPREIWHFFNICTLWRNKIAFRQIVYMEKLLVIKLDGLSLRQIWKFRCHGVSITEDRTNSQNRKFSMNEYFGSGGGRRIQFWLKLFLYSLYYAVHDGNIKILEKHKEKR